MDEDQKYFDAMMTLTGTPEWDMMVEDIEKLIYEVQANSLEVPSWDQLCEGRGFAKGLQYIIGIRDRLVTTKDIDNAPV